MISKTNRIWWNFSKSDCLEQVLT